MLDLAYQRSTSPFSMELIKKYPGFPALNQQKFTPHVLQPLSYSEVEQCVLVWIIMFL